jgi:plastocyanin
MKAHFFGAGLALMLTLGLAPATMADSSTTITITDSGFNPPVVNVPVGTNLTFVNKGNNVHTATALDKVPNFDTGGIGPGQTASATVSLAGTFGYSSQPDCLNGNTSAIFNCQQQYQVVVGSVDAQPSVAPSASIPAVAPGPNAQIQQNAAISLSDNGFSPAAVAIVPGGTVTWTNLGTTVHTVTSGAAAPQPFDSGGLAPAGSYSVQFPTPGTYLYSSNTDCQNGNNNPAFNCGATYTVTVLAAAVGSTTTNPGVPFSGPTIIVRDDGFQPSTTNATAGQTITWLNISSTSHSIASVAGSGPQYDSGGLADGSSFSFVFTQPGTYAYYSPSEQPQGSTGPQPGSPFTGTIVVK